MQCFIFRVYQLIPFQNRNIRCAYYCAAYAASPTHHLTCLLQAKEETMVEEECLIQYPRPFAVVFANSVTVPSSYSTDWVARKGPCSLFKILERMLPEVPTS